MVTPDVWFGCPSVLLRFSYSMPFKPEHHFLLPERSFLAISGRYSRAGLLTCILLWNIHGNRSTIPLSLLVSSFVLTSQRCLIYMIDVCIYVCIHCIYVRRLRHGLSFVFLRLRSNDYDHPSWETYLHQSVHWWASYHRIHVWRFNEDPEMAFYCQVRNENFVI